MQIQLHYHINYDSKYGLRDGLWVTSHGGGSPSDYQRALAARSIGGRVRSDRQIGIDQCLYSYPLPTPPCHPYPPLPTPSRARLPLSSGIHYNNTCYSFNEDVYNTPKVLDLFVTETINTYFLRGVK